MLETSLIDVSALANPVFLTQVAFENFARAALGQRLWKKFDTARDFVASDKRVCMRNQLIAGSTHARFTDNHGMYGFTPGLIGNTDHRRFQDRGVRIEGILNFDRVDVFAA